MLYALACLAAAPCLAGSLVSLATLAATELGHFLHFRLLFWTEVGEDILYLEGFLDLRLEGLSLLF